MSALKFLLIQVFFIVHSVERELNPNGPMHVEYASKCLVHLLNETLAFNKLITIVEEDYLETPGYEIQALFLKKMNELLRWSYESTNGERNSFNSFTECHGKVCKNHFQTLMRSHYYMVISKDFNSIYQQMKKIMLMKTFRHKSIYLIYYYKIVDDYKETALKILEKMYQLKHYRTYVFIAAKPDKFNIYVYDLYSEATQVCGSNPELVLMNYCEKGTYSNNKFLIRTKYKNLRNCSVNAVAMKLPPYVINEEEGLEIRLLNALGQYLNITFNISLSLRSEGWGYKNGSSWDGLLAKVIADPFTIGIGGIALDTDRVSDFDFTNEYFVERMVWIVPAALQVPHWKVIFIIFRYGVWLTLIFLILIFGVIFFELSYHNPDEYNYLKTIGASMIFSFQTVTANPVALQPKTKVVRILFIHITMFSIVICCLYQSCLIDVLTNPRYEYQLQTETEIFDSDYVIGGIAAYRNTFNETDKRSLKIYNNYKIYHEDNDTMYEWILTVARDRNTITILGNYYVTFLLAQEDKHIVDHLGHPKIYIVEEILFHFPIRMLFPKGFPLRDVFNQIIDSLTKGGIVEKWAKELLTKKNLIVDNDDDDDDDDDDFGDKAKVITIEHVQGAFTFLVFGCVIAIVFFLLELIHYRFHESNNAYTYFQRIWRRIRNQ